MSLTTLLVLYTLFSQTSSSLPKTSYIKMIDIWFFLDIAILFVIIILHIIIERVPIGQPVTGVQTSHTTTVKPYQTEPVEPYRPVKAFERNNVKAFETSLLGLGKGNGQPTARPVKQLTLHGLQKKNSIGDVVSQRLSAAMKAPEDMPERVLYFARIYLIPLIVVPATIAFWVIMMQ